MHLHSPCEAENPTTDELDPSRLGCSRRDGRHSPLLYPWAMKNLVDAQTCSCCQDIQPTLGKLCSAETVFYMKISLYYIVSEL